VVWYFVLEILFYMLMQYVSYTARCCQQILLTGNILYLLMSSVWLWGGLYCMIWGWLDYHIRISELQQYLEVIKSLCDHCHALIGLLHFRLYAFAVSRVAFECFEWPLAKCKENDLLYSCANVSFVEACY
jgi:hypothetical protein